MKTAWKVLLTAATLYAGYWLAKWVSSAAVWMAAHAKTTITLGIAALTGAKWLKEQPWAGADVLASLLGTVGWTAVTFGMGAWIGKKIATAATIKVIPTVSPWKGMPGVYGLQP